MDASSYQWFPVVLHGSQWFPVIPGGFQWFPVVLKGFQLFSTVPSGSKWFPVVPSGFQWFSVFLMIPSTTKVWTPQTDGGSVLYATCLSSYLRCYEIDPMKLGTTGPKIRDSPLERARVFCMATQLPSNSVKRFIWSFRAYFV